MSPKYDSQRDWRFDMRDFPLVRITYPSAPRVEDVARYAAQLRDVYRLGRFASVVDVRPIRAEAVNAKGRALIASSVDALVKSFPGGLVAEAVVVDSPVLHGVYTAYQWLRRAERPPSRACFTMREAERWCEAALRAAGLLGSPSSAPHDASLRPG